MRVIICGAGSVGYSIAERLVADQHDVTMIDNDLKLVQRIRNTIDARIIYGHGAHPESFEEANAQEADMLISVMKHDENNMIACQVADILFDIPLKIARIRSQAYLVAPYQVLFYKENLSIDVIISPEREAADMVLRRISLQGALDVLYFVQDKLSFLAVECTKDCPILHTPLRQLTELFPELQTTVVAVKRDDKIFIAHSNTKLLAGDIAYLTTPQEQMRRALGLFGHEMRTVNRILIAGGGNIGFYVAQSIEMNNHKVKVKIIEEDKKQAEKIIDSLRKTKVLHGSALDPSVLQEANIENTDLFIALTNKDQVNILSSIMAKNLGAKDTMVLLDKMAYKEFGQTVDADSILNPRNVTISKILQQIRRGRIHAVYTVANGQAEVLEAEVTPASPLIGPPLAQLKLAKGLRIGAIYRKDKLIVPQSTTEIKSGDRIILFALSDMIKTASYFFRVSQEYF